MVVSNDETVAILDIIRQWIQSTIYMYTSRVQGLCLAVDDIHPSTPG